MKNLKYLVFLFFASFLIMSCGDDDPTRADYVETLSAGDWTMTSQTLNGVERDFGGTLTSHVQTHLSCDLDAGECSGSNSYVLELDNNGGTVTGGSTFTWTINEDVTTITFNVITQTTNGVTTNCTADCQTVATILEWTENRHVLEITDDNGDVYVRTMERI